MKKVSMLSINSWVRRFQLILFKPIGKEEIKYRGYFPEVAAIRFQLILFKPIGKGIAPIFFATAEDSGVSN